MKKLLILITIIALGTLGFRWYINSGEVLDEAAPVISEKSTEKMEEKSIAEQIKVKDMMDDIIPDEPAIEEEINQEELKKAEEMTKEAMDNLSTLSDAKKKELEKEITEHLNPNGVSIEKEETKAMPEEKMESHGVSRQGSFNTIDVVHSGSGQAIIFPDTADGPILRLENFSVTRGPDLYVYLSRNENITSASQLGDYRSLGKLKSSKGNQNYPLPEGHEGYKSIVIWCQAFGVLFSSATLN
jgi:hypothetical protein